MYTYHASIIMFVALIKTAGTETVAMHDVYIIVLYVSKTKTLGVCCPMILVTICIHTEPAADNIKHTVLYNHKLAWLA